MFDYRVFYSAEAFFRRRVSFPLSLAPTEEAALALAAAPAKDEPTFEVPHWEVSSWEVSQRFGWQVRPRHSRKGELLGWKVTKIARSWLDRESVTVRASNEDSAQELATDFVQDPEIPRRVQFGWRRESRAEAEWTGECEENSIGDVGPPDAVELPKAA